MAHPIKGGARTLLEASPLFPVGVDGLRQGVILQQGVPERIGEDGKILVK